MVPCNFCGNNMPSDTIPCPRCGNWNSFWTRKNQHELPRHWGPFIINKDYFEYKNQKVSFQDIHHIGYDTLNTITKLGYFMKIWESETAEITIYHSNETIIKEKGKALTSHEKKLVDLYGVYKYLSEASFVVRFNRYASSISAHGFFTYDGAKFFTDGQIETRGNHKISLSDWSINNHGSFFQLTPRDPSVLNKIGQSFSNIPLNATYWKKQLHGDLTFHTTMDKDVFCSLMLRIYNIQFGFNTALGK